MSRRLALLRNLPADERSARAGRVLDRWLRRDRRLRSAGLGPDDRRWGAFERDLSASPAELVAKIRADDPRRGPLFAPLTATVDHLVRARRQEALALAAAAGTLVERRFDLLGSGPTSPLRPDGFPDWHADWKSGRRWDAEAYFTEIVRVRGDGSDIKVPWELSRCQHLIVLGQAYRVAPRLDPAGGRALAARCAEEARAQILDWIRSNPPGCGPNWACAMEAAVRAAAWTGALALFRDASAWDDRFLIELVRSLWAHGRHIRRNLEDDPGGRSTNHFLADLAGLGTIAAALPELRSSAAWAAFARRRLLEEVERQIGDDGADYERSLPYHVLVTEMLLHAALSARLAGDPWPDGASRRLELATVALGAAMRDDGTLPAWGDGDDGRFLPLAPRAPDPSRDPAEVLALGARLFHRPDVSPPPGAGWEADWLLGPGDGVPTHPLRSSVSLDRVGLHVLRAGDLVATFSCGPVGTRGLGNHTHLDLLAITLWGGGREWIGDRGTGVYGADLELRQRLRSVGAHTTLQVGDLEPHDLPPDVDGLFRVVERAVARLLRWAPEAPAVAGEHDGYAPGGSGWVHARDVALDGTARELRVGDEVRRIGGAPAAGPPLRFRITLAPGIRVALPPDEIAGGGGRWRRRALLVADRGSAEVWIDAPEGSALRVELDRHSPRYGVVLPATTLVLEAGPARDVTIAWRLRLREAAP